MTAFGFEVRAYPSKFKAAVHLQPALRGVSLSALNGVRFRVWGIGLEKGLRISIVVWHSRRAVSTYIVECRGFFVRNFLYGLGKYPP